MKKKSVVIAAVSAILALAGIFGALKLGQNRAGETENQPSSETVETATLEDKSETNPETETAPEEEVEIEPESEEDIDDEELTEASVTDGGGIAPEFKGFWDEYEEFMKKYVSVMNDPENEDYEKLTEKYADYTEKASEYENSENLTDDEIHYMTDAQARITAMYADALLS